MSHQEELQGVAIIGLAGRFPGAKNVRQFWENLRDGVESVTFFTDEELRAAGVSEEQLQDPHYVKAGAMLEEADQFDAAFWDMIPREAEMTDPQQRVFLETAWEALETAGYDSKRFDGRIGVFAGVGRNTYVNRLYANPELVESVGTYNAAIGNDPDFFATRLSYKLDLTGPSVTVQTACSTSLVAIHLACQSLLTYESDMVLAGGSSVKTAQNEGYLYQEGGVFSPDGHIRAFDEKGQGMVVGNGVGVVVLKRLEDAVADGDHIMAVIKGSALNNDGSAKVGYTAPSVEQQAQVIQDALAMADIAPETVTYIEAHGTGTNMGDPIEIEALTQAFRSSTEEKGFCAVGSVKTNVGHLDTASGVTGLIKTVLAMQHQQLPRSLHFETPNPKIDFANSPFYVNDKLSDWQPRGGAPLRAGVSSFGIGGTNAHIVLEEAPRVEASTPTTKSQLLTISAKTATALDSATQRMADCLTENRSAQLADIAYTLQLGRRAFNARRIVVARDHAEAAEALRTLDPKKVFTRSQVEGQRKVAFLFSGQGAQYANMARELYETEDLFRDTVDDCAARLHQHLGLDLRTLIYPEDCKIADANEQLKKTMYTQPSLFVIEYALAKLWLSWGVQPQAMIGHSIGEFVAAVLAGVMELEDALELVAQRGRLMQSLPSGLMLAVSLSESEVQPLLPDNVSVAGINGPNACVVAGPHEAVEALEKQFIQRGALTKRLETSHAFHSPMMEPILEEFTALVRKVQFKTPQLPYLSNVTGTWITPQEATDPTYYARHLRGTVRFGDGVAELLRDPSYLLLEVGPGRSLSTLARGIAGETDREIVLTSVRHPDEKRSDAMFFLTTYGRLWMNGVDVNFAARYKNSDEHRMRVSLPTYPFERKRFYIDVQEGTKKRSKARQKNIADWFYIPAWKQTVPAHLLEKMDHPQKWLVFADEHGLANKVATQLPGDVVLVKAGASFEALSHNEWVINPANQADYDALFKQIEAPTRIAHFWNVTQEELSYEQAQNLGFYSLLHVTQALGEQGIAHDIEITVITNSLQEVTNEAVRLPARATIYGACTVIPQEFAHIACRSVDVDLSWSEDKRVAQLTSELTARTTDNLIAYRGQHRFVRTYEKSHLVPAQQKPPFRQNGVYLITGASDDLGLAIAEHLARNYQARLALVSPAEIASENLDNLRALGTELLVFRASTADRAAIHRVIHEVQERFSDLNGVLHGEEVIGSGLIQLKTRDMAARVLDPKVQGALHLEEATEHLQLDFFALSSRMLSTTGGFGQIDNCAANAFLGSFAHAHAARTDRHALTIDWGVWQFDNWQGAQTMMLPEIQKQMQAMQDQYGLTAAEGMEALERALASGLQQVIVSSQDFSTVLDDMDKLSATGFLDTLKPSGHRIASDRPYIAPSSDMEEQVAALWQDLFGVDQVSIHDNFFELGGNSLLAVQLVTRLRSSFGVELPMSALFEAATVAELSQVIESNRLNAEEIDEIEAMLREIESLSAEEIAAKLTQD